MALYNISSSTFWSSTSSKTTAGIYYPSSWPGSPVYTDPPTSYKTVSSLDSVYTIDASTTESFVTAETIPDVSAVKLWLVAMSVMTSFRISSSGYSQGFAGYNGNTVWGLTLTFAGGSTDFNGFTVDIGYVSPYNSASHKSPGYIYLIEISTDTEPIAPESIFWTNFKDQTEVLS